MDSATIRRLNQINRDFYKVAAENFDESRGKAWSGWKKLLPELAALPDPPSVLDVGCGNGRFGLFLLRTLNPNIRYHGIDNNPALLQYARDAITAKFPAANVLFEERDIVDAPPDSGSYDLVTLFGVIHHIPGSQQRCDLLRALADRVASGGLLVYTCWCFYEYERFRERIVPWPADLMAESHDYLLDWRRGLSALRYCHYVDEAENAALIAATGLKQIGSYRADGHTEDGNRYSVLRRE